MEFQHVIEIFQPVIIQIATQGSSGTGFYLKEYDLIVTNEHVVGRSQQVAIAGKSFQKMLASVWYVDKKHDLAFVEPPKSISMGSVPLGKYESLKDGDEVLAIGHPYGLNYTATQGVISKVDRIRQGLQYIQIDAAINPGNSGGPLVNEQGEVIGVNTFIIRGGDNLGFALPVSSLRKALDLYAPYKGTPATRCPSCDFLVLPSNIDSGKYCPSCGTEIKLPEPQLKEFVPAGAGKMIEAILKDLGYDIRLAREGTNKWEIKVGRAKVKITYNTESFFIAGDAYLCQLPREGKMIKPLYQFLLEENFRTEGLVFSCVSQNIILSAILYDLDMSKESGTKMLENLLKKAGDYFNILINSYECTPRLEDE